MEAWENYTQPRIGLPISCIYRFHFITNFSMSVHIFIHINTFHFSGCTKDNFGFLKVCMKNESEFYSSWGALTIVIASVIYVPLPYSYHYSKRQASHTLWYTVGFIKSLGQYVHTITRFITSENKRTWSLVASWSARKNLVTVPWALTCILNAGSVHLVASLMADKHLKMNETEEDYIMRQIPSFCR